MSVQVALQFIHAVRQDESLKDRIRELPYPASGEDLVRIGREAGFVYSETDLQAAFKYDWAMRSLRYGLASQVVNESEPS